MFAPPEDHFSTGIGGPDILVWPAAALSQQDANRTMSKAFMPTPAQIHEACRQIRKEWSPEEEQMRRAWAASRGAPIRVVRVSDVDGAAARHSSELLGQMD